MKIWTELLERLRHHFDDRHGHGRDGAGREDPPLPPERHEPADHAREGREDPPLPPERHRPAPVDHEHHVALAGVPPHDDHWHDHA